MNKISLSILSLIATSALLSAKEVPMYDADYAIKTKEVVMLSQTLGKDAGNFSITIKGTEYGSPGFFGSFTQNTDMMWNGSVNLTVDVDHCVDEDAVLGLEKFGFNIKSRIGDSLVAGFREGIKRLKENGARYVFVGSQDVSIYKGVKYYHDKERRSVVAQNDDEVRNSVNRDMAFSDFFQSALINKTFVQTHKETGFIPNVLSFNKAWVNTCFQKPENSSGSVFWAIGQVASLALGVSAASAGNVELNSLAANSSQAINYATSKDGKNINQTAEKFSGMPRKLFVRIEGYVDPLYIDKNKANMKVEGYHFPIEEVEEHLAHYMTIPYKVGKFEKY